MKHGLTRVLIIVISFLFGWFVVEPWIFGR